MEHKYPVGSGWWPILDEYLPKIEALGPDLIGMIIKEKFGECRVGFIDHKGKDLKALQDIVDTIRVKSVRTCECCGRPGEPRADRDWVLTLCDDCNNLSEACLDKAYASAEKKYYAEHPKEEAPEYHFICLDAFIKYETGKLTLQEYADVLKQNDRMYWLCTPSQNGEACLANGKHEGIDAQCAVCDHRAECFPDPQHLDS